MCGIRGRSNRIVGGSVTQAHAFPWMVAISKEAKIYCGGTLISSNYIMTAAHCVNFLEPRDLLVINKLMKKKINQMIIKKFQDLFRWT